MKAEIEHGYLMIYPDTKTEEYAVSEWIISQSKECSPVVTTDRICYTPIKKTVIPFRLRFYGWVKGIYKLFR